MSDLKFHEKMVFEKLFDMGSGYVMTFSNNSFESFFEDFGIKINEEKYMEKGGSKANRLRGVWKLESNEKVAEINRALILYLKVDTTTDLYHEAEKILNNLEQIESNSLQELKEDTNEKQDARRSARIIIQEGTYLVIKKLKEKGDYSKDLEYFLTHPIIDDLFEILEKYQSEKNLDFKLADNKRSRERWIKEALEKYGFVRNENSLYRMKKESKTDIHT